MPVRGYFRVRTGKRTGLIFTTPARIPKGFWRTLYWITIGWVIWIYKWFFIILYRIGRFFVRQFKKLTEWLSNLIHTRSTAAGYQFTVKQIRVVVLILLILIIIALCFIFGTIFNKQTKIWSVQMTQTQSAMPTATPTATSTSTPTATSTSTPTTTPTPLPTRTPTQPQPTLDPAQCESSYPDFCIPINQSSISCSDLPRGNFTVLPPDPYNFDGDGDGVGCE